MAIAWLLAASLLEAVPPIVVNVVPGPNVLPPIVSETVGEADAIWRAAGFRLVWRVDGRPAERAAGAVELRVVIGNETRRSRTDQLALGWILFDGGRPREQIVLSLAGAEAFMLDARQASGNLTPMTRAQHDRLVGRALGRALAHELAHYLLATKAHTLTGLLRAAPAAQDFFSTDRSGFRLDDGQRALIAARLRRDTLLASR